MVVFDAHLLQVGHFGLQLGVVAAKLRVLVDTEVQHRFETSVLFRKMLELLDRSLRKKGEEEEGEEDEEVEEKVEEEEEEDEEDEEVEVR